MTATSPLSIPREPLSTRIYRFVSRARFATISLLLHTILVLLTASVVIVATTEPQQDFVASGDMFAESSTEFIPVTPIEEPQIEVSPTDAAAVAPTLISTAAASSFNVSAPASSMHGLGAEIAGKVSGAGKGIGASIGGVAGGTRMNFGTKVQASSFVFAVDVSGSMISGEKSAKTYAVLEKEIARVIRQLDAQSRFGLVVFSKDAKRYKPELVRATSEEKDRAMNWLRRLSPEQGRDPEATPEEREFHHGTRADRGLEEAFALQPDVIFFVSDGEPTGKRPPEIMQQVLSAQAKLAKPALINVVAYCADSGQKFMQELAQQNRGTFKEIKPTDVD